MLISDIATSAFGKSLFALAAIFFMFGIEVEIGLLSLLLIPMLKIT